MDVLQIIAYFRSVCVLPLAVIQKKSDQCLDVSAIFAVQSKGCTMYNGVLKVQTCVVEIYNNMLLIADTTRFLTFALKFDILYVLVFFLINTRFKKYFPYNFSEENRTNFVTYSMRLAKHFYMIRNRRL